MRQVYVLRRADKDLATGELTDRGRDRAKALGKDIGEFELVITADRARQIETATLLTGKEPRIDERAGFVYSSAQQGEELGRLAKAHPLSHAGVIRDRRSEFRELAMTVGNNLAALIFETMAELKDGGRALIVSQDGVMVEAEQRLGAGTGSWHTFAPLEGFVVNQDLTVRRLQS